MRKILQIIHQEQKQKHERNTQRSKNRKSNSDALMMKENKTVYLQTCKTATREAYHLNAYYDVCFKVEFFT